MKRTLALACVLTTSVGILTAVKTGGAGAPRVVEAAGMSPEISHPNRAARDEAVADAHAEALFASRLQAEAQARAAQTAQETSTTVRRADPPSQTAKPRRIAPSPVSRPSGGGPHSGTFRATCYGPPDFPQGQGTSTGRPVGPGSLAVDPRVIPYGSHVHIDGWGDFVADDTGGAIKGNRLDIWRSSCSGFPNPTVTATW